MNEGLIPRRYAKALLKYAIEKQADRQMYGLMNRLLESFIQFPELESTIANPFIDADKKIRLLTISAGATPADDVFTDFLKLLRNNNRLSMARAIAIAYADDYRRFNNIYKVEVTSAAPMPVESESRLKKLILSHLRGGSMEYVAKVDPSLIGGFTVTVGSERLDASIKNELSQIHHKLLG